MKILITEAQQKALDELQWLDNVPNHMMEYRFPMTPKIYQIISGNQRIKTFHVSDIHNIGSLSTLIGTKKTISSFTFMSATNVDMLHGIQTKGGILYEVYGNLVIHSPTDIMSRPDENGIRWLDYYELLPDRNIWVNTVRKFFSDFNVNPSQLAIDFPTKGKEKTDVIKNYFLLAEKFVAENADEIKSHITSKGKYSSSWNEVLVNNIEIHDVYWTNRYMNNLYKKLESRKNITSSGHYFRGEGTKPLSPREERIVNDYPGWEARVRQKLESMSNGTVYGPVPEITPLDFVRERGGYVDVDKYRAGRYKERFDEPSDDKPSSDELYRSSDGDED